jgi:methyltransferase
LIIATGEVLCTHCGCQLTYSEKDVSSLEHAKGVLQLNGIGPSSIDLRAPPGDEILFPLLENEENEADMTMCNPPFFASAEEMEAGRAIKAEQAHTVSGISSRLDVTWTDVTGTHWVG